MLHTLCLFVVWIIIKSHNCHLRLQITNLHYCTFESELAVTDLILFVFLNNFLLVYQIFFVYYYFLDRTLWHVHCDMSPSSYCIWPSVTRSSCWLQWLKWWWEPFIKLSMASLLLLVFHWDCHLIYMKLYKITKSNPVWLCHPFLDKVVSVKSFCVRWLLSRANYRCGNHYKDQKDFFLNDERTKEKNTERKREASKAWS